MQKIDKALKDNKKYIKYIKFVKYKDLKKIRMKSKILKLRFFLSLS